MAEEFFEQAAAESKLVLLDFGAEWCSTCKIVDSLLEKAWPAFHPRLLWVKLDIHQRPDLVERFKILSVPTVILLSNKEEILWRKSGYFQVRELEAICLSRGDLWSGRSPVEKREILEVLNRVYDPDYIDRSVVDMGLLTEDDITIKDNGIEVAYGLTAPMCPFSAAIGLMIKYALEKKLGVPVTVKLKAGHYQQGVVAELLQDPQRSRELMRKLEEFGVLERCVRL